MFIQSVASGIDMIDSDGYRFNVGIIVANYKKQVLWSRRIGSDDLWQFPQGGIEYGESTEEAMYREINEELGLASSDVKILDTTSGWLKYDFPNNFVGTGSYRGCVGQKQRWYLLLLLQGDAAVNLNLNAQPEFDRWCWVDYWYPLERVVEFKRKVYREALETFERPLCIFLGDDCD